MSLIPNPLHPAVVHLPVAIAVLVPIVAVAALVFIRRGARANGVGCDRGAARGATPQWMGVTEDG
ncbi:MAG TPA: hypothetical protein VF128_08515 [Gemmatimonadaceae bacterium]